MKLISKIISLLKRNNAVQTITINEKYCHHYTNRGMFIFNAATTSSGDKNNDIRDTSSQLKMLVIFVFMILISSDVYCQSNGFFSTRGKEIIDPEGNPVLLKGTNLGNWLVPEGYMFHFKNASSPRLICNLFNELIGEEEANKFWAGFRDIYITYEDIKFIKSLGFNHVRIPFNYRLFVTEHPNRELKGVGYELLDRAVKWCKVENLYIILDMHCAPGGQTGDNIDDSFGYPFLFESPESQQLTIDIWKRLAEYYKDETIIIGYDLLNEPIAHYFDADKLNPLLEPLFMRITSAIREVDTNHIVFIGGAQWNSNFSVFGPPFDNKLVYSFHKYWTEPTLEVVKDYIEYSNKYNVPIWMGESGENTNEWISQFRSMLEENNIGWTFWPYKKMKSERGIVSILQPDEFDIIIEYANKPRISYEDIRTLRPDFQKVKLALKKYLENCGLSNCIINEDYIEALGLK